MNKKLVILVNLGSPNNLALQEIEHFLYSMLSDPYLLKLPFYLKPFQKNLARKIAKKRANHALELYKKIKGQSVLLKITELQAQNLSEIVNLPVSIVMRYSNPSLKELEQDIEEYKPESCTIIPLYPQYSTTTTESSFAQLKKFFKTKYPNIQLDFIHSYHNHPLFIAAWVENIARAVKNLNIQKDTVLLFSAHGLPESYLPKGDHVYVEQLRETVKNIMSHFPQSFRSILCFQSKFGREKWLEPSTDSTIQSLTPGTQVLLIPISFVSEHLETLYEMDIEFKEVAQKRNLIFRRIPALNKSKNFIHCLAELALQKNIY